MSFCFCDFCHLLELLARSCVIFDIFWNYSRDRAWFLTSFGITRAVPRDFWHIFWNYSCGRAWFLTSLGITRVVMRPVRACTKFKKCMILLVRRTILLNNQPCWRSFFKNSVQEIFRLKYFFKRPTFIVHRGNYHSHRLS